MGDVQTLADVLRQGGPWGLLALTLVVIGWQYRDARQREAAHLQTAMLVAPLAQRLADCVTALERVTQQVLTRGGNPPGGT